MMSLSVTLSMLCWMEMQRKL